MQIIDIEQRIIDHLSSYGIAAFGEVPKNTHIGEFVTVERTGGDKTNIVFDHPVVAVQSWAEGDDEVSARYRASRLSRKVDEVMLVFDQEPGIDSCKRNALGNFPDLDRKLGRYQAVYNITTTY